MPGQISKEIVLIFQYFNRDSKVLDMKITLFTVSIAIEKF